MALGSAIGLATATCGLDSDRSAPAVGGPDRPAPCQGTQALIPELLAFIDADGLEPLQVVVQRRFVPSASHPDPDPSIRSLAAALLRLVGSLGLEDTGYLLQVAATEELEVGLGPWVSRFLGFIDGRIDGRDHYDAADAGAWFIQRCDPDFLLTGLERLLRLQSPSAGEPWIVAVVKTASALATDPELAPFLTSFDGLGGSGRPAITELLAQIMTLVADPDFDPERIELLLQSAVYPLIDGELEANVRRLMVLLREATDPAAGVLEPLQGSLRCGLAHPAQRDVLLGTLYDLFVAPTVGLTALLEGLDVLAQPVIADQLDLLADALAAVRDDLAFRGDLQKAATVLLSTPDVRVLVPMGIDLIDEGVAAELVDALATLLIVCSEAPGA